MYMMYFALRVIGELTAGAIAAVASCWLAWTMFKLVRRPEWGPLLVFAGGVIVLYDRIAASSVIQTMALVSGLCAALCWLEGEEWRARHPVGVDHDTADQVGRALVPPSGARPGP